MKRIVILIMFFSVVFCACAREENKETVSDSAVTESAVPGNAVEEANEENEVTLSPDIEMEPKQEEECIADYASDTSNGSIIYNSFIKCQDYKRLKQLDFSPCQAMEKKIEEMQYDLTIKQIEDISFEYCNISGNNKDIIMVASVETDVFNFDIMFIFLDSRDESAFDIVAQEKTLNYQLADLNGDGKLEILVDCLGITQSRKYVGIYGYEQEIMPIFEKNVDSFQYDISYRISVSEIIIKQTKYYYNKSYEKKKAKIVEYVYTYDNNNMVLLDKKTVWKSKLKDFKAWTIG